MEESCRPLPHQTRIGFGLLCALSTFDGPVKMSYAATSRHGWNIPAGRILGVGLVVGFVGLGLLLCQSHDFIGDFLASLSLSANTELLCRIDERVWG